MAQQTELTSVTTNLTTSELWNRVNLIVMAAQAHGGVRGADRATDEILTLFGLDPDEED